MTENFPEVRDWQFFRERCIQQLSERYAAILPTESKGGSHRACIVNGCRYPSVGNAARALGLGYNTIYKKLSGLKVRQEFSARWA